MKSRYLESAIKALCFKKPKMAFISGPRQAGKTTFAKHLLKERGQGAYYNWDEVSFRRLWTKNPLLITKDIDQNAKPIIVLDEIHKAKLWKRNLKGVFDTLTKPCDIIVTGSTKLNTYRKGSDSLLGRYYSFRLHPLSLHEILYQNKFIEPDQLTDAIFDRAQTKSKTVQKTLEKLIKFGPFPEPYFSESEKELKIWQRHRQEKIIKEDIRDLSRTLELSQIEMLASLLPEKAANPLSIPSLSSDLEVDYNTIKRWLSYLRELYYFFDISPYSNKLARSLKKEKKAYLWDWSEVKSLSARFENLIASHLLKYCHYLTDTGYGKYELKYLKTREHKEIDFVIVKENTPWIAIEVKLNHDKPSENWEYFLKHLPFKRAIQVTLKPDVFKLYHYGDTELLLISADEFLTYLI